jgi:hypothetical protein
MPLRREASGERNSLREMWKGSINEASLRGLVQMKVSGQFHITLLYLESEIS